MRYDIVIKLNSCLAEPIIGRIMPLTNNVSENIKELVANGHSQEQAVAIAMKQTKDSADAPKYYGEQISENMIKTPEGYLVCLNVPIASPEPMTYNNSDIGLDTDSSTVMMSNPWEELSSPSTIASFEAKPVTVLHPDNKLLDDETATDEIRGIVVNVRADQENQVLVADLVIISNEAIEAISSGITEVSCGYSSVSVVDNGDGTGYRIGIIGNHVAIVPKGRCGSTCSINDSKGDSMTDKTILDKIKAMFTDADTENKEDVFDAKEAYDALAKEVQDMKSANDAAGDKTDQILSLLNQLVKMEQAEASNDSAKTEDDDDLEEEFEDAANDADDVIPQAKVIIPDLSILANDSDDSIMTPAKMNIIAREFYNQKGK